MRRALLLGALSMACSSATPAPPAGNQAKPARGGLSTLADPALPPALAGQADGADDNTPTAMTEALRQIARGAQFIKLESPPDTAHPVVCDLVAHAGSLFASHTVSLINREGARVHRYDPAAEAGSRWSLAFDYRGGQGFSRLRRIGSRVVAVDADSTSAGFFGLSKAFVEAYLFASDEGGTFDAVSDSGAPARTVAMAGSLHSFDAITYGDALVVTGGAGEFSKRRPRWPGALWVGDRDARVLEPSVLLGFGAGVVRTTYMQRFGGRLYVGFQNNEARAKFDMAVVGGDPRDPSSSKLGRVTAEGGWLTRRFAAGGGSLYWVASGYRHQQRERPGTLFRSTDGANFDKVALPAGAGAVQDIAAVGETAYVLTTQGLYVSQGRAPFAKIAPAPPGDPFGRFTTFCSAPLIATEGALYAGSVRDGSVYQIAAAE